MMFGKKWMSVVVLIVLVLTSTAFVGVASAQDNGPDQPGGSGRSSDSDRPGRSGRSDDSAQFDGSRASRFVQAVAAVADMSPQDVIAQIAEGKTPAQILEESGADVEAVVSWLVSAQAVSINRAVALGNITADEAAEQLAEVEADVRAALDGELPLEPQRPVGVLALDLVEAVAEATGMTEQEVAANVADGETLADILTEAGADVDALVAEVVATETERINQAVADGDMAQERAAEVLANLEETVTNALERATRAGRRSDRPGSFLERVQNSVLRSLTDAITEATGLTRREVIAQMREQDVSLGELLEANGADLDTIVADAKAGAVERINEAVEDGTLTQERADELLAKLDEAITRILEHTFGAPDGEASTDTTETDL
jgi:hypothetical protein